MACKPCMHGSKVGEKYVYNVIIFSQITLVEFVLEQIGKFSKCVKILILQGGLLGGRLQCFQGQRFC